MKKVLALILVLGMMFSMMSISAFAEEPYVAMLAGTNTYFTNLNDAFTAEYNPSNIQVVLISDCEQDVDITSGGFYSFYLNGYTLNGSIKLSEGTLHIYGSLNGSEKGKIVDTGINGEYPVWFAVDGSSNLNIDNCEIIATEANGTAIYADGAKAYIRSGTTVTGNIETDFRGDITLLDGYFDGSLIVNNGSNITVKGGKYTQDPTDALSYGMEAKLVDGVYVPAVASWVDASIFAPDEDGAYLIGTVEELEMFRALMNANIGKVNGKTFKLIADLDMNNVPQPRAASGSGSECRFTGTFDGNNHTIKNFVLDGEGSGYVAFIGNTTGAIIKDLTFENISVSGGQYTAGIVGFARSNTQIINCHLKGNINISGSTSVGGIFGGASASITGCSVKGETGSVISGSYNVAGIAGLSSMGGLTVSDNEVSGIEISGSMGNVGGIIGRAIPTASNIIVEGNNVSDVVVKSEDSYYVGNTSLIVGESLGGGDVYYGNNVAENSTVDVNGAITENLYPESFANNENAKIVVAKNVNTGEDYFALKAAFDEIADGETIKLVSDITLSEPINFGKSMKITLDGNGYTVRPSANFSTNVHGFNMGINGSNYDATKDYTIKNVVFEGWPTDHTVRLEGIKATVEACTFRNNIQPKPYGSGTLGIVTVTRAETTIKDCLFENNDVIKCIDVNSNGDDSQENTVVENCIFRNNVANGVAIILYSDGASLTVDKSKFEDNTVNLSKNGAVVYLGFIDGGKVTNSIFKNNEVNTVDDSTKRVAGAIYAGNAAVVNYNVFKNNIATRNGADAGFAQVCDGAYYNSSNFEANYWSNGDAPVVGEDIYFEYVRQPLIVDSYYTDYSVDSEGNISFDNLKPNPDKLVLSFEPTSEKGVYDIVITTSRIDRIINELSTAKFTFVNNSENNDGTAMGYAIAGVAPYNYIVEGDAYTFYAKDGAEMTNNTSSVTIGQVTFGGYGEIDFTVDTTKDNNVIVKTSKDNAEVIFEGDILVIDTIGTDGEAEAKINEEIQPEMAELTIEVDYVHNVKNNAADYQKMTIEITGLDLLNGPIVFNLGDDGEYAACDTFAAESNVAHNKHTVVVEDKLIKGNSYTVKVYGDGYRTAEYTIRMDDAKTLKFWNNVMTNVTEMVTGEAEKATKVNFLAGDILPDEVINVYDLSAVVSYFGETPNTGNDYIRYDLNRDGKIDGLDISILLNSWGK